MPSAALRVCVSSTIVLMCRFDIVDLHRSIRFFDRGDRETENAAAGGIRFHPQTTPVRLDDRSADRKTHAESLRLCGEERIEYLLAAGFVDAASTVGNRNNDLAVLNLRADTQALDTRSRRDDRLDRV